MKSLNDFNNSNSFEVRQNFDNSKIERVPYEIERRLKNSAENFFQIGLKDDLNDKTIYSDESIEHLDEWIPIIATAKLTDDERYFYLCHIVSYFGQYMLTKFKGNWVFDIKMGTDFAVDFLIKFMDKHEVYYPIGLHLYNLIYKGEGNSLKSKIFNMEQIISIYKKIDSKN
jgi:hypothetical protein